jgi:hypothetical protein
MGVGCRMTVGCARSRRAALDAGCRVCRDVGCVALWSSFPKSADMPTHPTWSRAASDGPRRGIGWCWEGTRHGPTTRQGGPVEAETLGPPITHPFQS